MFILVSGISGSGKTELMEYALSKLDCLEMPKAVITREVRPTDKLDSYIIVTKKEFKEYISNDMLLEYQLYKGNYYGVLKQSYKEIIEHGKVAIREIAFEGIQNIKSNTEDIIINIFIDVDDEIVSKRMLLRGDSYSEIEKRNKNVKEEYQQLKEIADIIFINNRKLEESKKLFLKLIQDILQSKGENYYEQI